MFVSIIIKFSTIFEKSNK